MADQSDIATGIADQARAIKRQIEERLDANDRLYQAGLHVNMPQNVHEVRSWTHALAMMVERLAECVAVAVADHDR